MKTSWNNIKELDAYLLGQLPTRDRLLMEAKLQINAELRIILHRQKLVHKLLRFYHRKKLKEEIKNIGNSLMTDPEKISFQQKISQIFN